MNWDLSFLFLEGVFWRWPPDHRFTRGGGGTRRYGLCNLFCAALLVTWGQVQSKLWWASQRSRRCRGRRLEGPCGQTSWHTCGCSKHPTHWHIINSSLQLPVGAVIFSLMVSDSDWIYWWGGHSSCQLTSDIGIVLRGYHADISYIVVLLYTPVLSSATPGFSTLRYQDSFDASVRDIVVTWKVAGFISRLVNSIGWWLWIRLQLFNWDLKAHILSSTLTHTISHRIFIRILPGGRKGRGLFLLKLL